MGYAGGSREGKGRIDNNTGIVAISALRRLTGRERARGRSLRQSLGAPTTDDPLGT